VQAIAPEYVSVLSLVDLREVPADRREAALNAALHETHSRRFDLERGPLWSVQLIRLAENRHVLHLTMHHIISDEWSVQVLLREVSDGYARRLAGRHDAVPELAVQYADYACWQ
jgi:NRPS condensation-like uncharacterized protein